MMGEKGGRGWNSGNDNERGEGGGGNSEEIVKGEEREGMLEREWKTGGRERGGREGNGGGKV